ncbi:MAG TPA: fibronectin type III domain-containing protein, partial [Steroidobacteraceae bacterium]|nr:fibronectin type III domain-containing protein [Steroidobacteraceae bacterium]
MRFHPHGRIAASCLAVTLAGCGSRSPTTPAPPPAVDTEAPAVPGGLSASVISNSQIALSWMASTDNVGVTGYLVERCTGTACANFVQLSETASTMLSDTGLAGPADYSYRVRAADAAGNMSDYSPVATASTPAPADTTPPTAPSGLAAAAISISQVNLSWTASSDATGVTGYLIERCQGAGCTNFTQVASTAA